MSVFVCLVRTDGAPVYEALCRKYGTKREVPRAVPPSWCMMGDFAAMLGSDVPGLVPRVARLGEWVGVGLVRLDEQPAHSPHAHDRTTVASTHLRASESRLAGSHEVESRSGSSGAAESGAPDRYVADLTTVLELLAESGASGVSKLVGDFAFVAWNSEQRQLVAARDTFGVRRLYLARRGDLLTFSTRASLLARTESYDLEYFAEYLLHGDDPSGRTAFREVEAVRSAEVVTWERGTLCRKRYWEPPEEGDTNPKNGPEIVEEFRDLLFDAVKTRLAGETNVWSHLTGGMDSSSVVAVAQTLAARGETERGLAGVATYESDPPLGGDVDHARLVAERYGLRHEVLRGWRVWEEDGEGLPLLDQPAYEQANYAIERRLTKVVTESGGSVLLTGVGGDLYLRPQFERAADLLARGRVGEAVRVVGGWAVATRQSFWKLFALHAVHPMLPTALRFMPGRSELRIPHWIDQDFSRRFDLRSRAGTSRLHAAPWKGKSHAMLLDALLTHAALVGRERIGETNLEWRHPYFHRPLVEYGLLLPEEWRAAPGADVSKRVLREAMRGLLPEPVRLRRGKGALRPDIHISLIREARPLSVIAANSILGDMGCVVSEKFSRAIIEPGRAARSDAYLTNLALTLETWLRQRSDRWS